MKIAIVIPVYKERDHILSVISKVDSSITSIIVVDDACPDQTGSFVEEESQDSRIHVVKHDTNQGVGGAVITGYKHAIEIGMDIVVKIDGDGQMDPALVFDLVKPIQEAKADYVKANRFYSREALSQMPWQRLIGNALFSFVSKASSGYWNLMDPTNGFTAIHVGILKELPLAKIAKHYFFESDMLFRLNIQRARVIEVPIPASYGTETSSINILDVVWRFPAGYLRSFLKRVLYSYFLHDFNAASLQLVFGSLLLLFGVVFGSIHWLDSFYSGIPATTGTVMLAALPTIMGFQMLLNVLTYDVMNVPK